MQIHTPLLLNIGLNYIKKLKSAFFNDNVFQKSKFFFNKMKLVSMNKRVKERFMEIQAKKKLSDEELELNEDAFNDILTEICRNEFQNIRIPGVQYDKNDPIYTIYL